MLKLERIFASIILVALWLTNAQAQSDIVKSETPDAPTVTGSASDDYVRFAAPSSIIQVRLEVYSSAGTKVFDKEVRGGNVLDWHLQDGQAGPLADDSYLCVVTVKSLSGRITKRIGSVTIDKGSATVRPIDVSQMNAQRAQAIGPMEENASLTVLKEDENLTTTVIAHTGEEGQITRGRGALSFRIGDFLSGKDSEQLRLTAEGNLGIGITHPQARLDVDGLIKSSQGIVFPDGSIQYSAATRTYGAKSSLPGGSLQSKSKNSSGGQEHIETVSQNVIPKADNAGNLVNTVAPIFESVGGNVGIGTTTPDPFKLNVNGALNIGGSNLYLGGFLRFTDNAAAGYTNFLALKGNLTNFDGVNYEQLNLYNPGGDKAIHLAQTANGSQIASIGAGNTTLTLQPSGGNVGIGTAAPSAVLHVVGSQPLINPSGPGAPATQVLGIIGGKGGDSVVPSSIGGAGANVLIQAGEGGNDLFGLGGHGGSITLQPGSGGQGSVDPNPLVGPPGDVLLAPVGRGRVGIGTNAPGFRLHVIDPSNTGLRVQTNATGGTVASFGGNGNFEIDSPGNNGGRLKVQEDGNIGIGLDPGTTSAFKLGIISSGSQGLGVAVDTPGGNVARFGTNGEFNIDDNQVVGGRFRVTEDSRVLINYHGFPLTDFNSRLVVNGMISAVYPPIGLIPVCFDPGGQELGICISSIRYKDNVKTFVRGLDLVERLRPVSFDWKQNGMADMGLIAEEVAKEEPLLATYDAKGEIQGVKYDRVAVVLLNAVKEQQAQITQQAELIKQQQTQLAGLKRLVCKSRRHSKACN